MQRASKTNRDTDTWKIKNQKELSTVIPSVVPKFLTTEYWLCNMSGRSQDRSEMIQSQASGWQIKIQWKKKN